MQSYAFDQYVLLGKGDGESRFQRVPSSIEIVSPGNDGFDAVAPDSCKDDVLVIHAGGKQVFQMDILAAIEVFSRAGLLLEYGRSSRPWPPPR